MPPLTSFSAPLWAGFAALVNQQRAAVSKPILGFADPTLYRLAKDPASYARDFHDITRGNNGLWPAMPGYDDVTGWGSLNGHNLIHDLVNQ